MEKSDWSIAEDWFASQVGWFMIMGDDNYPARGEVTSTSKCNERTLRFYGSCPHEEGGETLELSIHQHQNGLVELDRCLRASDCDGPLDRNWSGFVRDGEIVEESRSQRDYFAETWGY